MSGPAAASVVVATRNRADRLAALLDGLRAQTLAPGRFEVVVVDDGSTDATPNVLERARGRGDLRLTALRQQAARGPAAARNRGWRAASAPVVAFTDDDCVPTPTWLEALVARAGEDTIVKGRTAPDPSEAHRLGPFAKTVDIDRDSPHCETCNIAYPRAVLERVGGFDESYPSAAGEDSDLGARALATGARAMFAREALVHHAVIGRGPLEALGDALLATDGVRAYKLNPSLRTHLANGVFYNRSHPLLAQAVVALALARRSPLAVSLCLPYLLNLRGRRAATGASPGATAWLIAFDAVQIAATIRGAVRDRVLVL